MSKEISPVSVNDFEAPLPTSPDALMRQLQGFGIPYTFYEHEAVFTVEQSNRVDAKIKGCHTRNLFIRDKKERMYLVTLRHDTMIDLNKLSVLLGAGRFSFGSPERLWTYLGVRPGSVTPFAIVNDKTHKVKLILEHGMMQWDIVNFHPLINTMTIGLTPNNLLEFMRRIDVEPQIIDLSAAQPDS